ncbi:TonB family protein [Azospirillum brasilense]|nr:TonB family protein [Azospirillum brasilense]
MAPVRAWLRRHNAEKVGRGGQAVVKLTLGTAGEVPDATILTSGRDEALDRAALAAVRKASPFPIPPPGLTAQDRVFSVPFLFRPRGLPRAGLGGPPCPPPLPVCALRLHVG